MTRTDDWPPDKWSTDCPEKEVKVELSISPSFDPRVEPGNITRSRIPVEIPTTDVSTYMDKNGPADINSAAHVECPIQWGGASIADIIAPFQVETQEGTMTFCRVYKRNRRNSNEWKLIHHGFISGVGGSGKQGRLRFWSHGFEELAQHIPFGHSFQNADPRAVARNTMINFQINTPVFVAEDSLILGPNSSREQVSMPDDPEMSINPDAFYFDAEVPDSQLDSLQVEHREFLGGIPIVGDTVAGFFYGDRDGYITPQEFLLERHTIVDALNWVCEVNNGIWYFEPLEHGTRLDIDFAGDNGELSRLEKSQDRGDIKIIKNTALQETAPINTVIATSDVAKVEIRATNLWDRAITFARDVPQGGDAEIMARLAHHIDIEAYSINETINKAKDRMRELTSKQGDGEIILYGDEDLQPHDIIAANYTCAEYIDDRFEELQWEIEEIHHLCEAGSMFKTRLYVSPKVLNEDIEQVSIEEL